jgi:hypothetical protein
MVLPLIGIATLLRCTAKQRLLLLFLEPLVSLAARILRPLMRCGIGNVRPR